MTNFLNINNYDLKLYYEVLEPFLEEHNNTVEEEGVWEVIRGLDYEELPILANVIYQIAFKKLENILHTNYHHELEIDYYINYLPTLFQKNQ
mgnify:FL=1